MKKPTLKNVPSWLKNKYALTAIAFVIWLCFFDRNDFISQYSYRQELQKLENDKAYYLTEIEKNKKDMDELMSDQDHLEKYAREKYLMKKDDEDIYLIVEDSIKSEE
jgi:cell division protein FtsB